MEKNGFFYVEIRSVDVPNRTLVATMSTGAKDRHESRLNPAGCQFDNFLRNPVVQWAHDYSQPPVAKAMWVRFEGEKIRAQIQFADYPFAQQIFSLYAQGFLSAFSVGFIPVKWSDTDEPGIRNYTEWELLELSCVPVPSNPEALKEAMKRGLIAPETISLFDMCESAPLAERKVIPCMDTPKDPMEATWEGSAEVAAADVGDLKVMCAWYDPEHADTKEAYKLPHHRAKGHNLVWRGLSAAMAALLGARGGVDIPEGDREGVYAHLAKHYKEFQKEAPEFRNYQPGSEEAPDPQSGEPVETPPEEPGDEAKSAPAPSEEIREMLREMLRAFEAERREFEKELIATVTETKDAVQKLLGRSSAEKPEARTEPDPETKPEADITEDPAKLAELITESVRASFRAITGRT